MKDRKLTEIKGYDTVFSRIAKYMKSPAKFPASPAACPSCKKLMHYGHKLCHHCGQPNKTFPISHALMPTKKVKESGGLSRRGFLKSAMAVGGKILAPKGNVVKTTDGGFKLPRLDKLEIPSGEVTRRDFLKSSGNNLKKIRETKRKVSISKMVNNRLNKQVPAAMKTPVQRNIRSESFIPEMLEKHIQESGYTGTIKDKRGRRVSFVNGKRVKNSDGGVSNPQPSRVKKVLKGVAYGLAGAAALGGAAYAAHRYLRKGTVHSPKRDYKKIKLAVDRYNRGTPTYQQRWDRSNKAHDSLVDAARKKLNEKLKDLKRAKKNTTDFIQRVNSPIYKQAVVDHKAAEIDWFDKQRNQNRVYDLWKKHQSKTESRSEMHIPGVWLSEASPFVSKKMKKVPKRS